MIAGLFDSLSVSVVAALPGIVSGLAVIAGFWVAALFVRSLVRRIGRRLDTARASLIGLAATTSYWALLILGLISGFGTMGVNVTGLVAGLGLTGIRLGVCAAGRPVQSSGRGPYSDLPPVSARQQHHGRGLFRHGPCYRPSLHHPVGRGPPYPRPQQNDAHEPHHGDARGSRQSARGRRGACFVSSDRGT